MSETTQSTDDVLRRALFVPCLTKEDLHRWICVYLGLNLPDTIVDPESNSSPMDMIWEIYKKAMDNDDPDFSRVMAYASRDSFKCVERGTLLLTQERGLLPIEEVAVGDTVWSGRSWRKVTHWIDDGRKEARTLELRNGARLTTSPIHRVWAWEPGGLPGWKRVSDLTSDDLVCWDTRSGFAEAGELDEGEFELGYICGALQGDGCLRFMDDGVATLTTADPHVLAAWERFCLRVAGRKPKQSKSRPYDWVISSVEVCAYLRELGLKPHYSWEKDLPRRCMQNRSVLAGFVSGLFDADGSVGGKKEVIFQMTAEKLLRKLVVALAALGVPSKVRSNRLNKRAGQKHQVHLVVVNQNDIALLQKAGVRFQAKKARDVEPPKTADAHDAIPSTHLKALLDRIPSKGGRWMKRIGRKPNVTGYRSITRAKLGRLLDFAAANELLDAEELAYWRNIVEARWYSVQSVQHGEADFFDLTVEEDHSYWSNGIISHNTLGAAILEVLAVLHLGRDVAHMAAIKAQAQKAQSYVKQFFRLPYLRDYRVSGNTEKTEIAWYRDPETGDCLTKAQYEALPPAEQLRYEANERYIKIVICSLQGANSDHVPFFCVDGSTEILVKSNGKSNRGRVRRTARDIFERLAGRSGGGRPGGEVTEEVLEPKERIEFLTLNLDTGELQFQPVTRAQRHYRETVQVGAGQDSVIVTADHPLFVYGKGYVQAGEIRPGDRLLKLGRGKTMSAGPLKARAPQVQPESTPEEGDPWEQVVLGSLLGDCGIYKKPQNNPYLQEQHAIEQAEYMAWKRSILSRKLRTADIAPVSGYTGEAMVGYRSGCSPLLLPYLDVRKDPAPYVKQLTGLGLAVWYMDDGCAGNQFRMSTEGFGCEQNHALAEALKERFGLNLDVGEYEREGTVYYYLRGGVDAKRRLVEIVGDHVHPTMAHKFGLSANTGTCQFCGAEFWFYEVGRAAKNCGSALCQKIQTGSYRLTPVTSVEPAGDRWVYDFTLPENHNFFGNGLLNHQCVDEVDVVPKQNQQAYQEAKSIPGSFNGKEPITLLTSTRKFAFGNVQRELDNADKSGLVVRHWNIIDVTERCPPSRHLPDEPKITIWYRREDFSAISQEEYDKLQPVEQAKYSQDTGYAGCLSKCKLFAMCRGNLATKQKDHERDEKGDFVEQPRPLLKSIRFTTNKFRELTLDMGKAQLMCWQASQEGLIFPYLDKQRHLLKPHEIAQKLTGEKHPETLTVEQLLLLMKDRDGKWVAGIDFGFTHMFSVVLMYVDGYRGFVVGRWQQPELDPAEKVDLLDRTIKEFSPTVYADTEAPDMIKFLKKHGYRCPDWTKGPGSVLGGIETIRYKLNPTLLGEPQLYFLDGGPGVNEHVDTLKLYHWALGQDGRPTDQPDEVVSENTETGEQVLDDEVDALRYAVMNTFKARGRVVAASQPQIPVPTPGQVQNMQNKTRVQNEAWARQIMEHVLGPQATLEDASGGADPASAKGKKGSIFWDMS